MADGFQQHLETYRKEIAADLQRRLTFIRQQVEGAGAKGVVVGISGGIDSALTAALCVRALGKERVIGIWMPIESQKVHGEDAVRLAKAIDLNLKTVDLGAAYRAVSSAIGMIQPLGDKSGGNTKARLRMTTLYAVANELGFLVADTCNRSEIYIGYMTKGGDGLADFNPLASLTKHQVRILAQYLGVPQTIISKPPTADLWAGQTDEQEMGFTYEELDRFLVTGEGKADVVSRIQQLHVGSEHKRQPMPGC
jgi:NAD+ synthase